MLYILDKLVCLFTVHQNFMIFAIKAVLYSSTYTYELPTCLYVSLFFFQAEDGIRDVERSRGLGDVYKDRTTGVSGRADKACSHP